MEQIAFINGETFIYWSSIILTMAVVAAVALFAALYLWKSKNSAALSLTVPLALVLSAVLSRLVHWYCLPDQYESMRAALTDYTWGGYALMGAFAGCLLAACIVRLMRVSDNLPQMLDCMSIAGGVGIAVGRLASLFNASDRGMGLDETIRLPFAYPVTDAVSGMAENRLATFMLQSISTAAIVGLLVLFMLVCALFRKKVRDGDVTLLFLLMYCSCQVLFDSTRYDSLFMRSNGFVSIVQILGLVGILTAIVLFSIRMVKGNGFKWYFVLLWVGLLALMGYAGYMEYYVQRHGDQAKFAYTNMGACLVGIVLITCVIRAIAVFAERKKES